MKMNIKDYKEATKVLWFWYRNSGLGFLSDAPSDGTTYGRKDGAWAAIAGGASDLQTLLDADAGTGYSSGNSYIALHETFTQFRIGDPVTPGIYTDIFQNETDLTLENSDASGNFSQVNLNANNLQLLEGNATGSTQVAFTDPIANTTLNFPAKTLGTYTIATVDDIGEPNTLTFGKGLTRTGDTITLGGTLGFNNDITFISEEAGNSFDWQYADSANYNQYNDVRITHQLLQAVYYDDVNGTAANLLLTTSGGIPRARFGMVTGNTNDSQIDITATSMLVVDEINSKGFIYAADYSANFTDRSLVDSAHVNRKVGLTGYTVATLPGTPTTGQREYVTDSTVAASGNFGATVVGGGANTVPVFFDGTNWIIA